MLEPLIVTRNFEEKVETSHITLWMDKEGFLCGKYTNNLHLSLDVAIAVVESRIHFSKGRSYPLLVDMRGIKSTTRKAREYMATMGATLVLAGALITGSPINRTLGNIFLSIDRPLVPIRLFTEEASARQWLRQYV